MTAINLMTKGPIAIIKWIRTSIMALALVISLFVLINLGSINKSLPTNLADLQKVAITVKSAVITNSPQFITPVEYPTQFEIDGQISSDVVAAHPVNAGDHVDISYGWAGRNLLQVKLICRNTSFRQHI